MKLAYVPEAGVLGIIQNITRYGADATWFVDGIRYHSYLEVDEYTLFSDFKEGIDD
jgi:hypothetical protein